MAKENFKATGKTKVAYVQGCNIVLATMMPGNIVEEERRMNYKNEQTAKQALKQGFNDRTKLTRSSGLDHRQQFKRNHPEFMKIEQHHNDIITIISARSDQFSELARHVDNNSGDSPIYQVLTLALNKAEAEAEIANQYTVQLAQDLSDSSYDVKTGNPTNAWTQFIMTPPANHADVLKHAKAFRETSLTSMNALKTAENKFNINYTIADAASKQIFTVNKLILKAVESLKNVDADTKYSQEDIVQAKELFLPILEYAPMLLDDWRKAQPLLVSLAPKPKEIKKGREALQKDFDSKLKIADEAIKSAEQALMKNKTSNPPTRI